MQAVYAGCTLQAVPYRLYVQAVHYKVYLWIHGYESASRLRPDKVVTVGNMLAMSAEFQSIMRKGILVWQNGGWCGDADSLSHTILSNIFSCPADSS